MIWKSLLTTLAICQISTFPIWKINHIPSNTDIRRGKAKSSETLKVTFLSNGLLKQTQTDSNQKYFQGAHDHNKSISMKTDVNSGEGWVGSNCEVDVTPQLDRLLYNLLPNPPSSAPQHPPNPSIPRCPPSTPTIPPNLTTISIPRSQTMSRLCIIWLLRLRKAIKSLDK